MFSTLISLLIRKRKTMASIGIITSIYKKKHIDTKIACHGTEQDISTALVIAAELEPKLKNGILVASRVIEENERTGKKVINKK